MTLDEAIGQFKYDAECNRADLDLSFAEDNDKVAEWLEELKQYRAIGTVSVLQDLVIGINALADSQFSAEDMAKLVNDMKSLYEYQQIGTPEECMAAVEKQKEMIAYCDENDCSDCHFHNTNQKYNKCMNDFIADEIAKCCGVNGKEQSQ